MKLNLERIRELREAKGLTQTQAATMAGMGTKQAWNNLERGRDTNLTLDRLQKIADVLDVTAKDLIE